jgi:hypothetical protein
MNLIEILQRMDFKIIEGYEFGWDIFGPAWAYLFQNDVDIVFNTETSTIYLVTYYTDDYNDEDDSYEEFVWVNPEFLSVFKQEYVIRKLKEPTILPTMEEVFKLAEDN